MVGFGPNGGMGTSVFRGCVGSGSLGFFRHESARSRGSSITFVATVPTNDRHLMTTIVASGDVCALLHVRLNITPTNPTHGAFIYFLRRLGTTRSVFGCDVTRSSGAFLSVYIAAEPRDFSPRMVHASLGLVVFRLGSGCRSVTQHLSGPNSTSSNFRLWRRGRCSLSYHGECSVSPWGDVVSLD